jgi:hypothetical protein
MVIKEAYWTGAAKVLRKMSHKRREKWAFEKLSDSIEHMRKAADVDGLFQMNTEFPQDRAIETDRVSHRSDDRLHL